VLCGGGAPATSATAGGKSVWVGFGGGGGASKNSENKGVGRASSKTVEGDAGKTEGSGACK
jgi:hypothetical protein